MSKNIFNQIINTQQLAIVGASRSPQKVGYQVLKNIINSGYKGKIYPVNPSASQIQGLKTYPTLSHLPQVPTVIVVVTPASLVLPIIEEAGSLGVKAAVIITAGFAEANDQGKALQTQILHTAQKHHLRLLGPNCLGYFSTHASLNATFGPALPQKGSVMLLSQSGALVTGVLDWAARFNLGLSHALTFGNRVDINENEAIEFAASDSYSKIIMVYLESFHNASDFFSKCSQITPKKPILLLKGGQSQAGQTASASHTAALATNYALVKAFAHQTGVIISETIQDWLVTSYVMATTPVTAGKNIGIITNAGGPGVLATDEAISLGLGVPPFTVQTNKALAKSLPHIKPNNPLDILGDAPPERFQSAINLISQDKHIDSLLTIITPQTTTKPVATARLITQTKTKNKSLFAVMLGGNRLLPARRIIETAGIPTFTYPNEAINTINKKCWYESHKNSFIPYPSAKKSFLSAKLHSKLQTQLSTSLDLSLALHLLKTYKILIPKSIIISQASQIPAALNVVGRPAVIKTAAMHLKHKARAGGVMLGIMNYQYARIAFQKLQKLHSEVLFQRTIIGAQEIILGAKRDAQLGIFLTVGLGGSLTDALADRAYAFIPTKRSYLKHIFGQTKAFTLLKEKGVNESPILDALESLTAIMLDFPQIQEMEINPAIITQKHLYACDIKITRHQDTHWIHHLKKKS